MKSKKGFTLIELLVVVLIIGILAAIAVPKYQKAVEKSKASQGFVLIKAIEQAMKSYHLSNGSYPTDFNQLDITLPSNFNKNAQFLSSGNGQFGKSNGDWDLFFETYSNGKLLYMVRISGKYKGAGFFILFETPYSTLPTERILCMERIAGATYKLDSNLEPGAFCEKIIQGKYINGDSATRWYSVN